MTRHDVVISVAPRNGQAQRIVVAIAGTVEHRDHINTDSAISRRRFTSDLAAKLGVESAELAHLDNLIVKHADEADVDAELEAEDRQANGGTKERVSQSQRLVELVTTGSAELWHNPDGDGYASIVVGDHCEHHAIRKRGFKRWLSRLYYLDCGGAPNSQAMQDALGVLDGKAMYDGEVHPVAVRVAEHDGHIYLDLANDEWQAVEITATGWRVVDRFPVRFRRAKAMLPLPLPVEGGSLYDLQRFVNVTSDVWPLVASWTVAALNPRGPFPLMCLHAEQGSGKSTAARALRSLLDPNTAPLRAEPKEPRDLMIAANNGWLVALDNLSHVPAWLSDALCRLSTGGGFSTRTLFENDEETIFDAMRPIILNGIEELATRGDLIDRSLLVNLLPIDEQRRRPEAELWPEFEQARPAILGALLTAVSTALRNLPTTKLDMLPRMADFAKFSVAAEPALGHRAGCFIEAYTCNRADASGLALDSSIVAKALLDYMASSKSWTGTASELLGDLGGKVDADAKRQRDWPKSGGALSGKLKRLAPNLRRAGLDVQFWRDSTLARNKMITVARLDATNSVQTVQSVQYSDDDDSGASINRPDRMHERPDSSSDDSENPGEYDPWTQ
jgi:hypothetical protein